MVEEAARSGRLGHRAAHLLQRLALQLADPLGPTTPVLVGKLPGSVAGVVLAQQRASMMRRLRASRRDSAAAQAFAAARFDLPRARARRRAWVGHPTLIEVREAASPRSCSSTRTRARATAPCPGPWSGSASRGRRRTTCPSCRREPLAPESSSSAGRRVVLEAVVREHPVEVRTEGGDLERAASPTYGNVGVTTVRTRRLVQHLVVASGCAGGAVREAVGVEVRNTAVPGTRVGGARRCSARRGRAASRPRPGGAI